jgi:hypothetical protein
MLTLSEHWIRVSCVLIAFETGWLVLFLLFTFRWMSGIHIPAVTSETYALGTHIVSLITILVYVTLCSWTMEIVWPLYVFVFVFLVDVRNFVTMLWWTKMALYPFLSFQQAFATFLSLSASLLSFFCIIWWRTARFEELLIISEEEEKND